MSKQVIVTADDHGPSINLVAWIAMTIMCLAALTKVFSRTWNTRSLPGDSIFIILAMVSLKLCGLMYSFLFASVDLIVLR